MPISVSRAARAVRRLPLPDDALEDPRRAQGCVHPLDGLVRLCVAALACQKGTLREVESLVGDLGPKLRRRLGLRRPPSDTTLYDLLQRLDPAGLRDIVYRQVRADLDSKAVTNDLLPFGMAAFDGKGGGSGLGSAPSPDCRESVCDERGKLFWDLFCLRSCLVSSSARPVLDQQVIDGKSGEPTHFPAMLDRLVARYPKLFRLVSGDANFTSRANAAHVRALGRDFLFCVKENRKAAFDAAVPTLVDAPVVARTVERAHGQQVTRELRRAAAPKGFDGLPGTTEFWSVQQTRLNPAGSKECEERIFATSLGEDALTDAQRLTVVRLHWGIENGPNWTADVILEEDQRSPCKNGNGMVVVSWLRLLAYNVLSVFRAHIPKRERDRSWRRAAELLYQALIVLSVHDQDDLATLG